MLKRLLVLSVFVFGSALASRADSISGYFSATGTDTFTANSITFDSAQVAGAIGGTFASYLTDGNPINFLPGALPYHQGANVPPPDQFPSGSVPLFSVSENGVTFTFNMTSYNADYITNATEGCIAGATCLNANGEGFFTADGAITGTSGLANFTFTSQYAPDQPTAELTSFSASAQAQPGASPIPEPASLALMGSGLLGLVEVARRKTSAKKLS